jgi:hypothetical protein
MVGIRVFAGLFQIQGTFGDATIIDMMVSVQRVNRFVNISNITAYGAHLRQEHGRHP